MASELNMNEWFRKVIISRSGALATSTYQFTFWHGDEYFFISRNGFSVLNCSWHSPDLAPPNFFCFRSRNLNWKFTNMTQSLIIKRTWHHNWILSLKKSFPCHVETVLVEIIKRHIVLYMFWGHTRTQLVEAFTASQKGSFPHSVIGIFCSHNPYGHTLALGWTQPLTNYQEYFLWG